MKPFGDSQDAVDDFVEVLDDLLVQIFYYFEGQLAAYPFGFIHLEIPLHAFLEFQNFRFKFVVEFLYIFDPTAYFFLFCPHQLVNG